MIENEEERLKSNLKCRINNEKTNRLHHRRPIRESNDERTQDVPSSDVSEDEELSCDGDKEDEHSDTDSDRPVVFGFRETVICFVIVVFVVAYGFVRNESIPFDWRTELNNMFIKFPSQQEDHKYALRDGINRILENPSKPSTFLFVHKESESRITKLFAYEYAAIAVEAMGTKSPVCLTHEKLKSLPNFKNDYGWIIDHYKPEIEHHGVLIVLGLEKLPGNLAQAFHFLCDEFTPAVDKSIYIFTLNYNSTLSSNPTATVEEILRNNWKKFLNEDLIEPLITRITNSVMVIQRENEEINNAYNFCD